MHIFFEDFSVNGDTSLTSDLANNLNFDYVNTRNFSEQYIYRIQQNVITIANGTVPQLTITLWSGT